MAGAVAYEWVLSQQLAEVHRRLTVAPDLGIFPGDGVHELFSPGQLEVSVRALFGSGDTTEFTTIVLTLRVREPVFVQPVDGQILDFEGAYIFNLEPITDVVGYEWVLTQQLAEVYRQVTPGPDLGIFPGDGVHELFSPGQLEVSVRGERNDGSFTDFTTIVIQLRESVLEFIRPSDGDTLDLFGAFSFEVDPVPDIVSYEWSFSSGGGLFHAVATLTPLLSILPGSPEHDRFGPGTVTVEVFGRRADGSRTPTASISIVLDPCPGLDLANCFAPEVRFHPAELWFPMDPSDFIRRSELRWAADSGCGNPTISHNPTPETLLRFATYERDGFRCRLDRDTLYSGADFTRPFSAQAGNGTLRPDNGQGGRLDVDEGFYLRNALDFLEIGVLPVNGVSSVPVFVEEFDSMIRYWFFYGYDPKSRFLVDALFVHQGDWERIEVRHAGGLPTQVAYFGHGCDPPITLAWGDPDLTVVDRTHPVVFVADGTHASYPGEYGPLDPLCGASGITDEARDGGPVWRTWEGAGIRHAPDECWYGFGGAWGDTGREPFQSDRTGPAGPPFNGSGPRLAPSGPRDCSTRLGESTSAAAAPRAAWLDPVSFAFAGGEPGFEWVATIDSVTAVLARGVVGPDGTASVDVVVPPGTPAGEHVIAIREAATGFDLSGQSIDVEPPAECLTADPADDVDGDGIRNLCDPTPSDGPAADPDGDGIANELDNCPLAANPGQEASTGRAVGLACDVRAGANPVPTYLELPFLDGPLCGFYVPTIVGTPGDDVIMGTSGDDVIFAAGGRDHVFARDGGDVVCGGEGDDFVWSGHGADRVDGGPGDDRIWAGSGDDGVEGGGDVDRVDGGTGFDACLGAERTLHCETSG